MDLDYGYHYQFVEEFYYETDEFGPYSSPDDESYSDL